MFQFVYFFWNGVYCNMKAYIKAKFKIGLGVTLLQRLFLGSAEFDVELMSTQNASHQNVGGFEGCNGWEGPGFFEGGGWQIVRAGQEYLSTSTSRAGGGGALRLPCGGQGHLVPRTLPLRVVWLWVGGTPSPNFFLLQG